MNNAKIGTALLGGYLLGRSKKAKLALSLGALLAGSRMNPGQVGKALQESPFVHTLTDQVRSELTGAGKAAATNLLSAKAGNLADALHERTSGLQEGAEAQEEEQDAEPDEEPDEENGEEPRGKSQGKPGPSRQKARSETSRSSGRGKTQGSGSGKSGKQDAEQPRKRKTSTSQSRSGSSGGGARSRRRDDG
ncbi:ABC transporter substrate-binding protein [Streptomyces sp. NBC_00443]|uniref:ABC transporter substrate-binding protein n=1 Tax=Streptomyces sp. NBC_00443 TaxID=2975743 RepID=UPI002E205707